MATFTIKPCEYCGTEFEASNAELKRGHARFCSISCGYGHRNSTNHPNKGKPGRVTRHKTERSAFHHCHRLIQNRCFRTGEPFDLTVDYLMQLWDVQHGICPLTGWELHPERREGGPFPRQASVDKMESTLGYVIGNIRFVAYIANLARGIYPDTTLIEFCRAVAQRNSKT